MLFQNLYISSALPTRTRKRTLREADNFSQRTNFLEQNEFVIFVIHKIKQPAQSGQLSTTNKSRIPNVSETPQYLELGVTS